MSTQVKGGNPSNNCVYETRKRDRYFKEEID